VLVVPASLDHLRFVTAFVAKIASHAGFAQEQVHRIELAVDEASANIIQHAYNGQAGGKIIVRVHAQPGHKIVITFIDTGDAFDPNEVPQHDPNVDLDNLKVGGLGIFLMRQAMDDVRFEFNVAGSRPDEPATFNRLTLVKHL
jgi:serine/threonine-protein kinase RsbW